MASRKKTDILKSTGDQPSATKPGSGYCPDAGDLIWIELDPTRGHERRGRRPALVLSRRAYNQRSGLCMACPVTSRSKGYPFEVAVPPGRAGGGVVLADQARSLSWPECRAALIDRAPSAVLDDVREKIAALLEIE